MTCPDFSLLSVYYRIVPLPYVQSCQPKEILIGSHIGNQGVSGLALLLRQCLGWVWQESLLVLLMSYSHSLHVFPNALTALLICAFPSLDWTKSETSALWMQLQPKIWATKPSPIQTPKLAPSAFLNEETTITCPEKKFFMNFIAKFERLEESLGILQCLLESPPNNKTHLFY